MTKSLTKYLTNYKLNIGVKIENKFAYCRKMLYNVTASKFAKKSIARRNLLK